MKKKLLAIVSGVVSAASIAFIYDKYFNKSKIENHLLNAESMQFFTKKITHRDFHSHERFIRENPLAILIMGVLMAVLIFNGGIQQYMQFFQTSIIQSKYTTKSFDGAVSPVAKVPKWTSLTTAERSYTYSQIPANKFMPLPRYNVSDFRKGLTWRADNERERNAYITYPVPNLGNYKLDGTENSGSHTGLDIKVPTGTPILSISRGVVIKAKTQTTGFGKHIVIMHKDVPDPKNRGRKTTLYSAYAHLSQIKVKIGQQVRKGQIIGLSGATGMATTPHLHFQIDTADAPFHPYWPIAWSDVTSHGLSSFFEAVKQGVNINKARQYTVHPMNLVTKNIGYVPTENSRIIATAGQTEREISRNFHKPITVPSRTTLKRTSKVVPKRTTKTTTATSTNRRIRIPVRNNSRRTFAFKRAPASVSNNRIRIASRRPNKTTTTLRASAPKTSRTASVVTRNVSNTKTVTPPKSREITSSFQKYGGTDMWFEMERSFVPGVTKMVKLFVNDSAMTDSGATLRTTSRDFIKIMPSTIKKTAFKNGYVEIKITTNSKKPFKIIAETRNGKIESPTLLAKAFIDISSIGKERVAAEYVKNNKIMSGDAFGMFKPDKFLNRAEAVKAIILASKMRVIPAKNDFNDVDRKDWFAKYVSTAFANELISGYAGNLFKPGNSITKAEFLKIALVSKKIDPADTTRAPYRDVPADSWYEKYFSFARNNGLLTPDSRGMVDPNKTISRIEAAHILYKLSQLR